MTLELASAVQPPPSAALSWSRVGWWLALAALAVVAVLERHLVAANTDVGWLLTAGEKMLDGERLYVGVIETNPPVAVLTYLPAIPIARALGIAPERVVDALVLLAIALSCASAALMLRPSSALDAVPRGRRGALAVVVVAILAILPMQNFGQREHIALIALLPALALAALRAKGDTPAPWAMVAAGLGAGITLCFKPHFALAVAALVLATALAMRSWRPLRAPETLIAAAVAALYGIVTALVFPDFFTVIVPAVRDVYLQLQMPLSRLLTNVAMPIFGAALLGAWMLKRRGGLDATFVILLAVAAGFAAAFLLQGKGWPYHSYPMIAVALLALVYALASGGGVTVADRLACMAGSVLLACAFCGGMAWFNVVFDMRELEGPVGRIAARPAILVLSDEPGFGHPLVRALHGVWVSRQQAFWVRGCMQWLAQRGLMSSAAQARMAPYAARERDWLIADIKRRPPDVVLVDTLSPAWGQWIASDPELAALLAPYAAVDDGSPDGAASPVRILRRR